MQANDLLTCVTCNVAFKEAELHRSHYKSDWHRYNLKRKVAELPAITAQDFAERVRIQNAQIESAQNQEPEEMFCKLCSKHFSTTNGFVNHKQSKKHKDLEASVLASHQKGVQADKKPEDVSQTDSKKVDESLIAVKSDRAAKKAAELEELIKKQEAELNAEVEMEDGDDKDWEDIGEDEDLDGFDETLIIPLTTCFFCDHESETIEEKCVHMAKEHSFNIPDAEHVSDLEGLMKHLGMKLGVYHVCLWCSSKCYKDLKSVQKHMQDKGHNKMKFQGETLLEYVDYYTYEGDTTIDDEYDIIDSDINDESMNSTRSHLDESGTSHNEDIYELVLPSGIKICHRSLFKYYKQSFGHRNLELKMYSNQTLKDKYRAIASGGTVAYNAEYQKQRKDIAYFKRWNAKMQTRLGANANKINMKYYRRQNITF